MNALVKTIISVKVPVLETQQFCIEVHQCWDLDGCNNVNTTFITDMRLTLICIIQLSACDVTLAMS